MDTSTKAPQIPLSRASEDRSAIRICEESCPLGQRLRSAREALGLTVEAAANATHIRGDLLTSLEANDLSVFSHPSYARFFALDYAKFLGLSIPEIKGSLPEQGFCSSEGYQYIDAIVAQAPRSLVTVKANSYADLPLRHWLIIIGKLVGLALILAAVGYGYLFMHKLYRLPDPQNASKAEIDNAVKAMSPELLKFYRPAFLNKEVPVFEYKRSY